MLNTPAPFPQVGSYALLDEDCHYQLVRIQKRLGDGQAAVSFPLRPDIASGTRAVALRELTDATPLTPADKQRLDNLARQILPALGRDDPALPERRAELDALRNRERLAGRLQRFLDRLKAKAQTVSDEGPAE